MLLEILYILNCIKILLKVPFHTGKHFFSFFNFLDAFVLLAQKEFRAIKHEKVLSQWKYILEKLLRKIVEKILLFLTLPLLYSFIEHC